MNQFLRQRVKDYVGLILVSLCLGIFISYIVTIWAPQLRSLPPGSQKNYASVGEDFPLFWTASYMALNGKIADIYNSAKFIEVEKGFIGHNQHHVWLYPPTFLLIVLPLALLPYLASLAVWLAITLVSYLLVIWRIFPEPRRIFEILCFPGIWINFLAGHNGFLSGALLGGGLIFLDRSPNLAGVLLGSLFYKPHLAILVIIALLAGRLWRVLWVTVVSAIVMGLASGLVLGFGTWVAFFQNIAFGAQFTDGPHFWVRMPTIYAAARLAGSGTIVAWILQGITLSGVIAGVTWVWSKKASEATRASILVVGILLSTGYVFIYDYAILAIPFAWLWKESQTTGWLSWERPVLVCCWAIPLINLSLSSKLNWPLSLLTLPSLAALFILVLKRHCLALKQEKPSPASLSTWAR
jgi:hypothetical protein